MDSGYRPDGGGMGCMTWLLLAAIGAAMFMMMAGGDDTTHTSADIEALSRNQVNLLSDVHNSYFDCNAAGSCIWTDTTTSTTTSTTSTRTDIEGDRNTVNNGLHWCANDQGAGYWTHNPCDPGYTEMQTAEGVTP